MATLSDIKNMLMPLVPEIRRVLRASRIADADDLSLLEINYDDPDEMQLRYELRGILDKLDDVAYTLEYLSRPTQDSGRLHRNAGGRFEDDFQEYTCGQPIEALVMDSCGTTRWVNSSVEAAKDYYIVGARDTPMEGVRTRRRTR